MERQRINVYIEKRQIVDLKALAEFSRIKQADYIREGIDLVLEKYNKEIKKAKKQKSK
tara:strand:- start:1279 stop:1452 length:174 start_codon:yes stop_codon:yes gene_type:complete